jgi:hypothetical protein
MCPSRPRREADPSLQHFGSARASRNNCATVIGIDGRPVHVAEVDDDADAQRAAGPVVPAALHRQRQTAIACDRDGQLDVFGRQAVNDGTRDGPTGFAQIAVAAAWPSSPSSETRPGNRLSSLLSARSI